MLRVPEESTLFTKTYSLFSPPQSNHLGKVHTGKTEQVKAMIRSEKLIHHIYTNNMR